MYTREILEERREPVEQGIPLQGTWAGAFQEVDLLKVNRPYPVPLIKKLKNLRIKEWESFFIQDDRIYLQARLCNMKYYRTALVFMYNKETKERLEFKKFLPGGAWRLPRKLHNASVESRSYGFFFRIHTWLDARIIQIELDVERRQKRPAFTLQATFDYIRGKTTPMAVSLLFSERRNMYAYKALAAVRGDLVSGGQHIQFDPAKTSGLFCDFKGYFPRRTCSSWCSGMGFDSQNRRFGFALGENQAKESYKNNENALWLDGRLTPLPPVRITQNGGVTSDWIIQDMEGMVDLVFTPRELGSSPKRPVFTGTDYEYTLGVFNGLVLNSEGEEIPVRNVWGAGEKIFLRV